ncbi:hypothetical protein ACWGIA_11030 [Streptomyces bobili]
MTRAQLTQWQVLFKAVRALGGTWDTQRTVTALRDAALLHFLAQEGLIVRIDPSRATYRVAKRRPS